MLDLLAEKTGDEAAALNLLREAKALGDAINAEREEREARLREAGFKESPRMDSLQCSVYIRSPCRCYIPCSPGTRSYRGDGQSSPRAHRREGQSGKAIHIDADSSAP